MDRRRLGCASVWRRIHFQANAALKTDARTQGQAFIAANASVANDRFAGLNADQLAAHQAEKNLYTARMSYGLPTTEATDVAAVVPKGAEVLLETRLSDIQSFQRMAATSHKLSF